MTDKQLLEQALEALENLLYWDNGKPEYDEAREAITAIKQALAESALDRMAENARELELDYEPVHSRKYLGVKPCWYENKEEKMCPKCGQVHAKAIFPAAQPAPTVQEPVGTVKDLFTQAAWERLDVRGSTKVHLDTPPAAQRQWVGLTDEDFRELCDSDLGTAGLIKAIEAKLREKNT